MRFVILVLVVLLLASLATYAVLNLDARVDVTLPGRTLQGQPQIYLVLVSLGIGMLFVGILSLLDGTRLRLANRRLRRELQTAHLRDVANAADLPTPAQVPIVPAATTPVAPGFSPPDPRDVPSAGRSSLTDDEPPYGM